MNDRFLTAGGARWNRLDRIRAERLFRAHVDTPSNRRAGRSCRIIRLPCHWHSEIVGEAHHIDYTRPFVVAWVGGICGCHRRIDHGSLKIPRKAIYDYTSLIEGPWGIAKMGLRIEESRDGRLASVSCICGKKGKHNPHRPECPKDPLREAERMAGVPF